MITISTSFLQHDNGKVTKLQYVFFIFLLFIFWVPNCNWEKQSMRDDIRKTKTSIFLTMVEEKLLLHGGVNGLFQTLIINYEITGAICLEVVILVFFTPVVINV